jgi:hypothetical protein
MTERATRRARSDILAIENTQMGNASRIQAKGRRSEK